MTAKEYLQQVYHMHRKVNRLKARREQLRAEMYSIGSPSGKMDADRVQTSMSGDTMLRLIAKVDSLERDIVYEIDEMLDSQRRIAKEIERIPNERQRDVLHKRYIECKRWEQIAVDLDVSVRYVYMVHGDALQAFAKMMS